VNVARFSLLAMVGVACAGRQHTSPTTARTRSAADDLVRRVQEAYRHTPRLTCRFRQTVFNKTFGLPSMHDGMLYVERPGTLRWDYFSKRDRTQVIISQTWTGTSIGAVSSSGKWHYRVSQSRSALPISVAFLSGADKLASDFDARLLTGSTYGTESDSVLELTPRHRSAQFKTLVLVVDPRTSWVKRSIVTSATGDTTEFTFYAPRIDSSSSRARR